MFLIGIKVPLGDLGKNYSFSARVLDSKSADHTQHV